MRYSEFLPWDDRQLIINNPTVSGGISNAGDALTAESLDLWHPVTIWSHQLDVSLFGSNPDLHHLSALIYHLLAGLALLFCLRQFRIGKDAKAVPVIAIFTTVALFLLHPMHVESWAWLSERKDTLSAIFGFLSLGFWLKFSQQAKPKHYAWALGFFALGLMSKPILFVWPAIMFLTVKLNSSQIKPLRKSVIELIPFVVLALATVYITISIQQNDASNKLQILQTRSISESAIVGVHNLGVYASKIVAPVDLSYFYIPIKTIPWLGFSLSLVALTITGFISYKYRKAKPVIAWSFLTYLVLLIPVCGFIMSGESNAPDRYSYLSYLGPFMLLALGYHWLTKHWNTYSKYTIAVILFCLVPGWFSIKRATDWRTMETLTNATLKHDSKHPYALLHQATYQRKKGNTTKAISLYEQALNAQPANRYHWAELGLLYEQDEQRVKAKEAFEKQLEHRPAQATAFLALAQFSLEANNQVKAIQYLNQGKASFPQHPEINRVLNALTD